MHPGLTLEKARAAGGARNKGRNELATPKPKMVVTLKLEASCPSHARTDVMVRDTETVIDEPVERGGTNLAPSPTETALAALAACTNVVGHKVAKMHGVEFQAMHVALEARLDRRGVTLQEEIDVPFESVRQIITVTTDADEASIAKVQEDLPKFCPVSKLFRQSGTVITDEWTVNRP